MRSHHKYTLDVSNKYIQLSNDDNIVQKNNNVPVQKNNLEQYLLNNSKYINTTYGTGVIPTHKSSNKCWKAFLSKINKR